jgi:hypothetical protein
MKTLLSWILLTLCCFGQASAQNTNNVDSNAQFRFDLAKQIVSRTTPASPDVDAFALQLKIREAFDTQIEASYPNLDALSRLHVTKALGDVFDRHRGLSSKVQG